MVDDLAEIEDRLEQVLADLRAYRQRQQGVQDERGDLTTEYGGGQSPLLPDLDGIDLEFLAILAFVAVIMVAYMVLGL